MVNEDRTAPHSRKTPLMALCLLAIPLALGSGSTLAGCGGDGTTGDTGGGQCFDYSSFKGDSPAQSFSKDVLPIFRRSCGTSSSCHSSESAADPAQHYLGPSKSDPAPDAMQIAAILEIVGASSVQEPDMKVVEAGKPDKSFLMYKLDGVECETLKCGDKCGTDMPQGSSPLSADERDIIRRWISQGAKND